MLMFHHKEYLVERKFTRHLCASNVGQENPIFYKLDKERRGEMDWITRMNSALDYIKNHPEADIEYQKMYLLILFQEHFKKLMELNHQMLVLKVFN